MHGLQLKITYIGGLRILGDYLCYGYTYDSFY
jgi:hypothetical protein